MKKKQQSMIIGLHAIIEAIEAGTSIGKIVLLNQGSSHSPLRKKLFQLANRYQIPCSKAPRIFFDKITQHNHQGAIAYSSPIHFVDLHEPILRSYEAGRAPLLVILDGVQDVRNMGAIARSALCMGASALVVPMRRSAWINEEAMKASAGALHHLPVCRVNTVKEAILIAQQSGLQVLACDEKAPCPIDQAELTLPTALLMGNEGIGIEGAHKKLVDLHYMIPTQGPIDSLNVSVATGMFLYEANRQRQKGSKN